MHVASRLEAPPEEGMPAACCFLLSLLLAPAVAQAMWWGWQFGDGSHPCDVWRFVECDAERHVTRL